MKTTLKTISLPVLLVLTAFAQGGDVAAIGLEQAIKFEYRVVEND